mgnify:CR=1 FL=1
MPRRKLSEIIELVRLVSESQPKKWTSPDVIEYITAYEEQHPEKKMTKHLMRKLERQYWRSVRAEAKKQKKP